MKNVMMGGAAVLALAISTHPSALAAAAEREIIVVQATQTEIDSFNYPGLTSVIDRDTLDLVRPVDLEEVLRGQPGVDVPGGPRRTGQTISLRGQGRNNTTLLLDGTRQNFDSAHDGALFIDPSLLVSVETVRGPASALYGSGASGGVVSFQTASADDLLNGDEQWGFNVGAGYRDSDGEERGIVTLYGRQGLFDGLISYSTRSSGDIALGSGADLPADDSSRSTLVNLGADLSNGVRAEITWQNFQGDATEPNNGQGVSTVNPFNSLVDKDIETDNLSVSFDLNPASISWLDANITLYRNESGVTEQETSSTRFLRRDLETRGIRANQRFAYSFGSYSGGLTLGGEYYRDEQNGEDSADPNGIRGGAPDAESEFTAFYAQLELEGPAPFGLPGEITILPGLRYDEFETSSDLSPGTSNDATSGRFGVTYAPIENFNVFINWAEAFRAPSINELYIDGTHFSLPHPILGVPTFITNEFIANPDLRPESTETVEIGFSLDLADRLNVDEFTLRTSWYETDAEDLIDLFVNFSFAPTCFAPPFFAPCSAGTSESRNVRNAELSGYEAQLNFAQGAFSLDASLSGIDGQDVATGDPLGSLTPTRFFLDGRYAFEPYRLTLGSRVEWAGEYDEPVNQADHRDSYTVVDIYARWRPLADHGLTLNAGVDNLFDEDYERVFAGVSEPAQSVRFDVSYSRNF
ncbi:MAG: TonB-dependent receptor [Alphaproteobacteria bacterium]|nr:TonB-dependent receptor [Alphaproteobacteria bacterium]